MIFVSANVLYSACFDSQIAHKFSQAKMASEAQKPLAKMEFLLVCGQLATVSLEPWAKPFFFTLFPQKHRL